MRFQNSRKDISEIINQLDDKLRLSDYTGFDPFDGLNSSLFNDTIHPLIKLIFLQFIKKSPFNFRSILKIHKEHNPKGLALILQTYCLLYKLTYNEKYLARSYNIADYLISVKTKDKPYCCWGYNFPWMARAFYVPRNKPNIIVSSFVGQAFLDLYELDNNTKWLQISSEVAKFINTEMILFSTDEEICFRYIPGEKAVVHNANLMGSRLLARLSKILNEKSYKELSIKATKYSLKSLRPDGAWVYGNQSHHQWIDNFHTGFNLVAISDIQKFLNTKRWQKHLDIGLNYHLKHHYLSDMTPKYYNNYLYPIDIHNYAQGIITFSTFEMISEAEKLLNLCIHRMWDANLHYFYYQETRLYINKINYLRWSQAWMLYSLALYIYTINVNQ